MPIVAICSRGICGAIHIVVVAVAAAAADGRGPLVDIGCHCELAMVRYINVGALSVSGVRIQVGVGQRCHSIDVDPPALQAAKARSVSIGAMDESSGKGSKVQAHVVSGVFMDNAALKVGHSVGSHQDAATLQAEKRST